MSQVQETLLSPIVTTKPKLKPPVQLPRLDLTRDAEPSPTEHIEQLAKASFRAPRPKPKPVAESPQPRVHSRPRQIFD